jgi:polysaccharide biosynthesis/export protein ExoF
MLAIVKKFSLAFIAIFALPPYSHELAVAPSAPSAMSGDTAGATSPEPVRPADAAEAHATTLQADRAVTLGQRALPEDRAAPAPVALAKLPLGIGDSLRIGFYETIDLANNGQSGRDGSEPQGGWRTFYQRTDLSGDYTVGQDGAVSIPLLGRFLVEGRDLEGVRTDLAMSFVSVFGRSANVDAKILDRPPIYVVGPVKNPGAYRYAPGMIVLQAIALAGGLDRGGENLSTMVEGVREAQRLRIATLQLQQLLARRARLVAERDRASSLSMTDGLATLPTPDEAVSASPIQLAKLDLEKTAGAFVATEGTILRAEEAKRQLQDREIALRATAARNEVNALKRKLDQFDVQKDLRAERLDAMQKLNNRGVVTSNTVLTLRTELADIEARRQDSLVAVVQAEARLAQAEGDSAKRSTEDSADLTKEIATDDEEIAGAREAMISARSLATILYRANNPPARSPTYEIVRQSQDGAKMLRAAETSPLMPGDVLKVNPDNAAAAGARSIAPTR